MVWPWECCCLHIFPELLCEPVSPCAAKPEIRPLITGPGATVELDRLSLR